MNEATRSVLPAVAFYVRSSAQWSEFLDSDDLTSKEAKRAANDMNEAVLGLLRVCSPNSELYLWLKRHRMKAWQEGFRQWVSMFMGLWCIGGLVWVSYDPSLSSDPYIPAAVIGTIVAYLVYSCAHYSSGARAVLVRWSGAYSAKSLQKDLNALASTPDLTRLDDDLVLCYRTHAALNRITEECSVWLTVNQQAQVYDNFHNQSR